MSRWRRVVRRELARFEEQTGSDVVELGDFLDQSREVFVREFPDNAHRDAKVRQVLQQLRDRGELDFVDYQGTYRMLDLEVDPADTTANDTSADGSPEYTAAEYETTVGARSMPAAFRDGILNRYDHRCPVSGVDHDRLLDVAHVLPWRDYPHYRTDPENVLPLSRTHHAAFDAGLFTLDANYRLRLHPDFETESDVLRGTLVDHVGDRIEVDVDADYLEHRNQTLDW